MSLYGFCGNEPIGRADVLGMTPPGTLVAQQIAEMEQQLSRDCPVLAELRYHVAFSDEGERLGDGALVPGLNSGLFEKLVKRMAAKGCPLPEVTCEPCSGSSGVLAEYDVTANTITIYGFTDRHGKRTPRQMLETLRHEFVHAYDACRGRLPESDAECTPFDVVDVYTSELRAYLASEVEKARWPIAWQLNLIPVPAGDSTRDRCEGYGGLVGLLQELAAPPSYSFWYKQVNDWEME